MVAKALFKKPILTLGILLFGLFLYHINRNGLNFSRSGKLIPSACKASLVMLNKRIPMGWKTECEGSKYNNLSIFIQKDIDLKDPKILKIALYRELANDLVFAAQNSPSDNLNNVNRVKMVLDHSKLKIEAHTTGSHLVKFKTMKKTEFIKNHLKNTVRVKEFIK